MIASLLHPSRLALPLLVGAMTMVGCSEQSIVTKSTVKSSPNKSSMPSPSMSPQIIATEIASLGISQHTITLQDPEIAVYETADWDDHDKNLILGCHLGCTGRTPRLTSRRFDPNQLHEEGRREAVWHRGRWLSAGNLRIHALSTRLTLE